MARRDPPRISGNILRGEQPQPTGIDSPVECSHHGLLAQVRAAGEDRAVELSVARW